MQFKKRYYINQESVKLIQNILQKGIVIVAKCVAQATDISSTNWLEQDTLRLLKFYARNVCKC
jgi:hypothetical protein